ncbi:hypothetical protein BD324DRAFT_606846 [Kockovaella imperatae]|uniref:BHLH domain-containing protein n=1 Tax=Kockovaella imperatae TaxID=4999 RepID=A0A1Y1UT94_9TREE|nr:hypothetical protein BD324DRAFT_606846 [Kockovaella imperatae]ORX41238.1 hypothetical protein BD324DRAFT_606846 [Kockovaella imperatae]
MAPPSSTAPRKRKLANVTASNALSESSPSADSADGEYREEDEDYAPKQSSSKRQSKPKATSKSTSSNNGGGRQLSREALRKANHSMIERRRREKINAALGELRQMVPGLGDTGGKGGEFKLEVLERTVEHMRDLTARLEELESRLGSASRPKSHKTSTVSSASNPESMIVDEQPRRPKLSHKSGQISAFVNTPTSKDSSLVEADTSERSKGSPSSQMSPPRAPSLSTLLASTNTTAPTRPPPGPQATNPTLYLPFPTPSPTSPFLHYTASTSSSSSLHTSTGPDPSPFMAPLQGMSLFGGALNLDTPGEKSLNAKGMGAEEAANVLLAFSSPDTLRPTSVGMTPLMTPLLSDSGRARRSTLDGEEFVLDGGLIKSPETKKMLSPAHNAQQGQKVGKTARDILRM